MSQSVGIISQNPNNKDEIVWRIANYTAIHHSSARASLRSDNFFCATNVDSSNRRLNDAAEFFLVLYVNGKGAQKNSIVIDLNLTGSRKHENVNVQWRITLLWNESTGEAINADEMNYREFGRLAIKKTQKTLMHKADYDKVTRSASFLKNDTLLIKCELQITDPIDLHLKSNKTEATTNSHYNKITAHEKPITANKPKSHQAQIEDPLSQQQKQKQQIWAPIKLSVTESSEHFPFAEAIEYENELIAHFKLRGERNLRSKREKKFENVSFNYIWLDPRLLVRDIFSRGKARLEKALFSNSANSDINSSLYESELMRQFVSSIFYIGKGQDRRPLEHLDSALRDKTNPGVRESNPTKLKRIQSIWSAKMGPIWLQLFTGICEDEAETREALLVHAIVASGIVGRVNNNNNSSSSGSSNDNLTNKHPVHYKMPLNGRQKYLLGKLLLMKALITFLLNGDGQAKLKFTL